MFSIPTKTGSEWVTVKTQDLISLSQTLNKDIQDLTNEDKKQAQWIDIPEFSGMKFKLQPLSIQDKHKFNEYQYKFNALMDNIEDESERRKLNGSAFSLYLEMARYYISRIVVDWDGVPNNIKCELVKGHLKPELAERFTENDNETIAMFQSFMNDLEMDANEKKN